MASAAELDQDQNYRVPHGFFTSGLSETDPAVEGAIHDELRREADPDRADRVGKYRQQGGARGPGLGAHQQICRRLSRAPLLPGLRAVGRGRDAGHRARQEIVRLPVRQRPAAFGRAGQWRGDAGAAQARRHDYGPQPRRRRPPHPRRAAGPVGQMVQRHPVRRSPRRSSGRFRRGRAAGEGASAQADHRRRLGLSAPFRLRPLPRDLRRGRRAADGRHGAFRRPGRGRRAPDAVRFCRRRHDDHAQDAARPARRHGADRRRGHRQEDQLGSLPGPAGRPADARHRRQGGRVSTRRCSPSSRPMRRP